MVIGPNKFLSIMDITDKIDNDREIELCELVKKNKYVEYKSLDDTIIRNGIKYSWIADDEEYGYDKKIVTGAISILKILGYSKSEIKFMVPKSNSIAYLKSGNIRIFITGRC